MELLPVAGFIPEMDAGNFPAFALFTFAYIVSQKMLARTCHGKEPDALSLILFWLPGTPLQVLSGCICNRA